MQNNTSKGENLPSLQECYDLWDKYKMPENIRAHSRSVARVADAVAAHIKAQGVAVDLDLVNRGALLHDIAKLRWIKSRGKTEHAKEGAVMILQEGWGKRFAQAVGNHGTEDFSFDLPIEDRIVNYADRRVVHDKIVSLEERLSDLVKRYPSAQGIIEEKRGLYRKFEVRHKLKQLIIEYE